jgi:hypothetical protein
MIKAACDPDEALAKENITRWLNASEKGGEKHDASWFIAGHTRLATRGKVNRQNSHPFRYGKIIGAHNGMVDAPKGYVVDSQYMFDSLNKSNGDYNAAWGDITGYWGVSWFDDDAFYLQVHNGEINIALAADGCWYYSSNRIHLLACIGHNETVRTIKEGETLKFSLTAAGDVVMETVAEFISTAPEYWTRKYGSCNTVSGAWDGHYSADSDCYGGGAHNYAGKRRHGRGGKGYTYNEDFTSHNSVGTTLVRDYDAQWREAWEEYTTNNEHTQVD